MEIDGGVVVYGSPVDPGALAQIRTCAGDPRAAGAALLADHHRGYSTPIGGVVAYRDAVSPSGAGYDIGCGNKAVRLDVPLAEVRTNLETLLDDIFAALEFGIGRANAERVDDPLFDDPAWRLPAVKPLRQRAQAQLGTVGSGNHYVDLFADESDRVWVGVHFGSRGLGHGIATAFLRQAGATDGMDAPPTVFDLGTPSGDDYWAAMQLAGRYAYAGRDWVCDRVARILGATPQEEVHNHHNYCWRETHGGEDVIVVRKGATPAFPGQRGFVGGSMDDISVILEGVDSPEAAGTWRSTVHGAGRIMSRTQAAGKRGYKGVRKGGEITREMMRGWLAREGVSLRGGGTDEAPHVYKRLPEVLAHHAATVRVIHTLRPLGVCMAGEDVADPYQD